MSTSTPPPTLIARSAEEYVSLVFPPKEVLITGLLHKRDLVALGARRRHGKTCLVTNLAVALAAPVHDFLGYEIPHAARSLLFILEDDPGEYQEKLRKVIGERDTGERIKIVTREDFYEASIRVDIREPAFLKIVEHSAKEHHPDLIVLDNLAQVIGAEYNDPKLVHSLIQFCYRLARLYNAAVILPAHPKKEDPKNRVSLHDDPNTFFESIMGSSHFINSTGSLWGLERHREMDWSVFLGGRQRGDGEQSGSLIAMDEHGWFNLIDEAHKNFDLVVNTAIRRAAWALLPNPPATFGYREGESLVKSIMKSASTYSEWIKQCRRLKVILDARDGKLSKAPGAKP
jgi:AAA domain